MMLTWSQKLDSGVVLTSQEYLGFMMMSSVFTQKTRLTISDETTSMEAVAHIVALPFCTFCGHNSSR